MEGKVGDNDRKMGLRLREKEFRLWSFFLYSNQVYKSNCIGLNLFKISSK